MLNPEDDMRIKEITITANREWAMFQHCKVSAAFTVHERDKFDEAKEYASEQVADLLDRTITLLRIQRDQSRVPPTFPVSGDPDWGTGTDSGTGAVTQVYDPPSRLPPADSTKDSIPATGPQSKPSA